MQRRFIRAAIVRGDANEQVFRRLLGVFDIDVEIPVIVEDAGVDEFKLSCAQATPPIFLDQTRIRKFRLRVFVERLHVGMRRRRVEVVVELLYVLTVIALGASETEETLL